MYGTLESKADLHFVGYSVTMSASSQNSSTDNYEPSAVIWNPDGGEDGSCFCGYPRLERVSWKYSSPGRRFWNCPNSLTKRPKCDYFDWKDPKLTQQCYKDMLLGLKSELDRKENWSELTFTRRKLVERDLQLAHEKLVYEKEVLQLKHENEVLKSKNEDLHHENGGLKLKISVLKKWLTLTKSVCVCLLVGLVACGMKVWLG